MLRVKTLQAMLLFGMLDALIGNIDTRDHGPILSYTEIIFSKVSNELCLSLPNCFSLFHNDCLELMCIVRTKFSYVKFI